MLQLSKHLWLVDVAISIVTSSIISTNTTRICSSTSERTNKIAVKGQDVGLGSSCLIGLSTAIEVALLGGGRCNSMCSYKKGLFATIAARSMVSSRLSSSGVSCLADKGKPKGKSLGHSNVMSEYWTMRKEI
jgi:hypothetical protein